MPRSIVVADDHTLIAKAITAIISTFRNYQVLYEVENGRSLIEQFRQPKNIPDIVLLDVDMPVMDGFQTAEWLKTNHPSVLVLVLSMQDKEETLIKMVRSGARGYLLKDVEPADLEYALDTIVEKGYFYPDWVTHKVLMNIAAEKTATKSLPGMNDRELEFVKYAFTELTYKEIADKMNCSPRTVESYRDNLFEKFGVKTRVGLVLCALKNDIVKLEAI
jgi:DNA-binding NarL/FixJ family response regulator